MRDTRRLLIVMLVLVLIAAYTSHGLGAAGVAFWPWRYALDVQAVALFLGTIVFVGARYQTSRWAKLMLFLVCAVFFGLQLGATQEGGWPVNQPASEESPLWNYLVIRPLTDTAMFVGGILLLHAYVTSATLSSRLVQQEEQRRAALDSVAASEERLRSIAENVPGIVYRLLRKANGKVSVPYASPRVSELLGYTAEEVISPTFDVLAHVRSDFVGQVERWIDESARTGNTFEHELPALHADGRVIWLKLSATPQVLEDGHTIWDGVALDVTDRIQAESALREAHEELENRVEQRTAQLNRLNVQLRQEISDREETAEALHTSEERFRLAFEESPLGLVIADLDYCIVKANAAFARMVGRAPDELVGRSMSDFTHPDDVDESIQNMQRVVAGQSDHYEFEKRYVNAEGKTVWGRVTAAPIRDGQGLPQLGLALIEDITQRKRTEQALRDAERMASIGTLAAGIAHEINNPAGAILLAAQNAQRALQDGSTGEGVTERLDEIVEQAKRCGRIVRSVLRFAKQESCEKWPADLNASVHQAVELTRPYARQREGTLRTELAENLPAVLMNPTEIEQVIVNLLRNALEADEHSPTVEISTRRVDDKIELSVRDRGTGISEEQRARLFDPFYTTRRIEGGTGLGLSLSYAIIADHGGAIRVVNEPAHSTTLVVELPHTANGLH